jgi:hypothetical protein
MSKMSNSLIDLAHEIMNILEIEDDEDDTKFFQIEDWLTDIDNCLNYSPKELAKMYRRSMG